MDTWVFRHISLFDRLSRVAYGVMLLRKRVTIVGYIDENRFLNVSTWPPGLLAWYSLLTYSNSFEYTPARCRNSMLRDLLLVLLRRPPIAPEEHAMTAPQNQRCFPGFQADEEFDDLEIVNIYDTVRVDYVLISSAIHRHSTRI